MALIQVAKPDPDNKTVVFVTFESEFAPLGGLAAVMRLLPRRMAQLLEGRCFTIAPFFKHITACNPRRMEQIQPTGQDFVARFGTDYHRGRILRHVDANGFITYLLDADEFFNAPCDCGNPPSQEAPCNPYLTPDDPDQLLQDALFFCAAVPKALVALGHTENIFASLQDWQTACAALTLKREPAIASVACTLTVHNPYDQPVSDEQIAQLYRRTLEGPTVLTKMLPFVDGPICTVSENFATELTQDALHTQVYAPHLQSFFAQQGVVGIDNGLFAPLDFPEAAITAARLGDLKPLLEEKASRRAALVRELEAYQPEEAWGTLDGLADFAGPIFLFFGRDDPRQKGYDVAVAAIRRVPPGQAKYVFTPIPGNEGLAGLEFLKALAEERPGEVKVFPFRMARGYMELLRGSSFLAMCSLYEPFGGATEGYAAGTPVVARATGGLIQQVAPYPGGTMGRAVRQRADRFHGREAAPTGILFREPDLAWDEVVAGWRHIVDCGYSEAGAEDAEGAEGAEDVESDRVAQRLGTPLFDALVREAAWAFEDAIEVYTHDSVGYAQMIAAGFAMLRRFSWDRAAREYQRLYDQIAR